MPVGLIRERLIPALGTSPEVFREDDGFRLALPGIPFATEGRTLDEAACKMVEALREYGGDWPRLRHAPNHQQMSMLVPFIDLSTDEQLLDWLTGRA